MPRSRRFVGPLLVLATAALLAVLAYGVFDMREQVAGIDASVEELKESSEKKAITRPWTVTGKRRDLARVVSGTNRGGTYYETKHTFILEYADPEGDLGIWSIDLFAWEAGSWAEQQVQCWDQAAIGQLLPFCAR